MRAGRSDQLRVSRRPPSRRRRRAPRADVEREVAGRPRRSGRRVGAEAAPGAPPAGNAGASRPTLTPAPDHPVADRLRPDPGDQVLDPGEILEAGLQARRADAKRRAWLGTQAGVRPWSSPGLRVALSPRDTRRAPRGTRADARRGASGRRLRCAELGVREQGADARQVLVADVVGRGAADEAAGAAVGAGVGQGGDSP